MAHPLFYVVTDFSADMELTTAHIQFIKEHAADDLARLLLSAAKYPGMDIPFLVDQIAARRRLRLLRSNVLPNRRLLISRS